MWRGRDHQQPVDQPVRVVGHDDGGAGGKSLAAGYIDPSEEHPDEETRK
jgi:hypothetical protein